MRSQLWRWLRRWIALKLTFLAQSVAFELCDALVERLERLTSLAFARVTTALHNTSPNGPSKVDGSTSMCEVSAGSVSGAKPYICSIAGSCERLDSLRHSGRLFCRRLGAPSGLCCSPEAAQEDYPNGPLALRSSAKIPTSCPPGCAARVKSLVCLRYG